MERTGDRVQRESPFAIGENMHNLCLDRLDPTGDVLQALEIALENDLAYGMLEIVSESLSIAWGTRVSFHIYICSSLILRNSAIIVFGTYNA